MADLEGLDPKQRAAYIQQLRLEAMAQDAEYGAQEYDSDDEALFMDNNILCKACLCCNVNWVADLM